MAKSIKDFSKIAEVHRKNCELSSVVFSVRVRIDDLAAMSNFMIREGYPPKSGGHALSQALVMFTEYLIANGKTGKFNLNDAKEFCEKIGIATGSKRNIRAFGSQFEESKVPIVHRDEMEAILKKLAEIEGAKAVECAPSDFTVPPTDDSLLSELEKGVPNVSDVE